MRNFSMLVFILAIIAAPLAAATESNVDISSPVDGAKLDAKTQSKLDYNITLGGDGDHIHVYVDDKQVALLRQMKGSYTLDPLAQGNHVLCIKIVNKNHTPIGVERCVKVTAQ